MEQFVVPQFIDSEDKILGPLTGRQFIIILLTFMTEAIMWRLMPFVWFLVVGLPLFSFGVILAFVRVNGQAFHLFMLNLTQSLKKPRLRVWDKALTDAEVRAHLTKVVAPPPPSYTRKAFTNSSRLQELTLVVNTGGVYKPED
ncbi:PrgI family protein [bacterium]|nr:PrgI family protein [bacterium]